MNQEEEDNLFATFNAVISSAINEKMGIPKWKNKLVKSNIKVNIALQIDKEDYFYVNLILKNGEFSFNKGKLTDDEYDIELKAAPIDMMWFSNGRYSTLNMITQKNQFGFTRLRVKKGGRNLGKLLLISNLLNFRKI